MDSLRIGTCDRILENSSKSHMKSGVFLHVFNDISIYAYSKIFLNQFSNLSIEFHYEICNIVCMVVININV